MSPRPTPVPSATTCSATSALLDEPLAGTAPTATGWLAIEQPGPWGARALIESHIDPVLGKELNHRAAEVGVRVALIRRPGHHALDTPRPPRRVLLAGTRPGAAALRELTVDEPADLLDLDFAALAAGTSTEGRAHPAPVLLICTNAKRDQCCAILGRALTVEAVGLIAATESAEPIIWEADHLGGHRFAPTAVILPTGYMYGRLDAETAIAALRGAAHDHVVLDRCRGRSTWSREGQAAELALRSRLGDFAADSVVVLDEWQTGPNEAAVRLSARSVEFLAVVMSAAAAEARPESCGKAFGHPMETTVRSIERIG
jgi:hypothetical protein